VTLADALQYVQVWKSMPAKSVGEATAAVRLLERETGRKANDLPASPKDLTSTLEVTFSTRRRAKRKRQKVERLEQALHDPTVSAAAVEALRSLIDAVIVHPGERRGEISLELRGDLAAFLYLADDEPAAPIQRAKRALAAAPGKENNGSGRMMGSLVAGAGFEPAAFRL
jgi:hypothetical protein